MISTKAFKICILCIFANWEKISVILFSLFLTSQMYKNLFVSFSWEIVYFLSRGNGHGFDWEHKVVSRTVFFFF